MTAAGPKRQAHGRSTAELARHVDIKNLLSADEIANRFGISAERLRGLADSDHAPHYRVDEGEPRFRFTEMREWIAKNLVCRVDGTAFVGGIKVVLPADRVRDIVRVPTEIQEVPNLRDVTGDLLRSGVYFLCLGLEVVYVGQAKVIGSRIAHHNFEWDRAYFLPWPSDDLDRVEGAFIRALSPKFNGRRGSGDIVAPLGDARTDKIVTGWVRHADGGDNNRDTMPSPPWRLPPRCDCGELVQGAAAMARAMRVSGRILEMNINRGAVNVYRFGDLMFARRADLGVVDRPVRRSAAKDFGRIGRDGGSLGEVAARPPPRPQVAENDGPLGFPPAGPSTRAA